MKIFFNRKTAAAFTLIEMLVVIAIIGILAALLMPSLQKARRSAIDTNCTNSMKQCLTAVALYNNDWRQGLQNYHPACPYWGKGWPTGHSAAKAPYLGTYYATVNGAGVEMPCNGAESQSGRAYWRAYLLDGGYLGKLNPLSGGSRTASNTDCLGCPVKSYGGLPWKAAYNGCGNTWLEGANAPTVQKNPPFIWYGAGVVKSYQVAAGTGGNLSTPNPLGVSANLETEWWKAFTGNGGYSRGRFPLFTCPAVYISQSTGINRFELPHRQEWGVKEVTATTPVFCLDNKTNEVKFMTAATQPWGAPFAGNTGFSDGSVRFRELNMGHIWNAKTWKLAREDGY